MLVELHPVPWCPRCTMRTCLAQSTVEGLDHGGSGCIESRVPADKEKTSPAPKTDRWYPPFSPNYLSAVKYQQQQMIQNSLTKPSSSLFQFSIKINNIKKTRHCWHNGFLPHFSHVSANSRCYNSHRWGSTDTRTIWECEETQIRKHRWKCTISSRFDQLKPITFEFFHLGMNYIDKVFKARWEEQHQDIGTLHGEKERIMRKTVNVDMAKAYDTDR